MENYPSFRPGKFWYLPLISGILCVLLSIWVMKTPLESFLTLSIFFAAMFFVQGIFEIFRAFGNSQHKGWGWSLAFGIIDLVFGILLLSSPAVSASVLVLYVGFMLMFRSISGIGFAVDLKEMGVKSWVGPLLFSILGIIVSAIMIFNPLLGGLTIIMYTAIALLMVGIFQIILSFALKKLK